RGGASEERGEKDPSHRRMYNRRVRALATAIVATALLAGCPQKVETGPAPPPGRGPQVGDVYVYRLLMNGTRDDEVMAVGTATATVVQASIVSGKPSM